MLCRPTMANICRHLDSPPIFLEPRRCLLCLHSRVRRLEFRLAHQSRVMRRYLFPGDMRRCMARALQYRRHTTRTFDVKCRPVSLLPSHSNCTHCSNTLVPIHMYNHSRDGRLAILLSCPITSFRPCNRHPSGRLKAQYQHLCRMRGLLI